MNSILETVCAVCTQVRQKSKQGISFQHLLTNTRREFKDHGIKILLRSSRKKYLNQEEFYINAYYDAEDDRDGEVCIEVIAYHNFDKTVTWDAKQISGFLIEIYDAVVHEFKHQRQSRKRNYKLYWAHHDAGYHYHEYLQDPDEIDAYAFSIAIELCRNLGKFRAIRYLPKFSTLAKMRIGGQFVSPNLNAYVGHFGNTDSPISKLLSKKIYIRLQKIDTDFVFV